MFAVRADGRYRSITDLKGARVVWNDKGSGVAIQAAGYLMSGLGLDMDKDFEALYPGSRMDGPKMVIDGRAAALWGAGLRWPGFIELFNSFSGARFVLPSAEEIKAILARHPFLREISVPAGLYRGQYQRAQDGRHVELFDGARRARRPDRLSARQRSLSHREGRHAVAGCWCRSTVENTLSSLSSPDLLQPGVRRFYKEKALLQ